MVDVVANHQGPIENSTNDEEYKKMFPFNKREYYHEGCPMDFTNQTSVEDCWLYDLADLAQENSFVKTYLLNWI